MKKKSSKEYYDKSPASKRKKKAYDTKYQSSPEQKKRRAKRNKARAKAISQGKVHKGDNLEVHHPKGIDGPTEVISRKANRSKREKSRVKGYKQKRK